MGGKHLFRQIAGVILSVLAIQFPATADVTITEHLVAKGVGSNYEWNRIIKIKGSKMRIESHHEKETFVTIYDLDSSQEMILQPKHRVASVFNLSEESIKLQPRMSDLKSSIQPTGKTKQLLGMNCEEYRYDVYAPDRRHMIDGHLISTFRHQSGVLCIARDTPGSKEFANFAGQMKSYIPGSISDQSRIETDSALFLLIAPLNGLVLEHASKREVGGGEGIGLYGSQISGERFSAVTDITFDPISNDDFHVPSDWKIRKDRSIDLSVPVRWLRASKCPPDVWSQ
jgi:hypothetical protein